MKFSKTLMQKLGFVSVVLMPLIFTNCGKEEKKATVEPNFPSLYQNVFSDCASCHAPGKQTYDEDLADLNFASAETAYATMTKTSTKNGCSSFMYIKANDAANSLVYADLDEAAGNAFKEANGTGCSIRPPGDHGLTALSAEALSAVKTWINNGATE